MKLLLDANIERLFVLWLRSEGHDALWAAEDLPPGMSDMEIIRTAQMESRIIITHDLDFGELVFKKHHRCAGVLLLRLIDRVQEERLARFVRAWKELELLLPGNFTVLSGDDTIRTRPIDFADD